MLDLTVDIAKLLSILTVAPCSSATGQGSACDHERDAAAWLHPQKHWPYPWACSLHWQRDSHPEELCKDPKQDRFVHQMVLQHMLLSVYCNLMCHGS